MSNLPRVLIFGQPFNSKSGGGITLTNLFRGWDKDKIAVAATGHMMYNFTTDVCDTYYQLGSDEFIWRFPFNYIQRKFKSGIVKPDPQQSINDVRRKATLRYIIVNRFFYPVLEWAGLLHNAAKIKKTENFKQWLRKYNPELLYFQVSSLDTIVFARELKDYLAIPAVIHMMDDWPSTISKRGPFRSFWSKRIDRELRLLFAKTDLFLSISDAMSAEYKNKYSKDFLPFHNPIDIHLWGQYSKRDYTFKGDTVKILYSGRIGQGISSSLLSIAAAIDKLNEEGQDIKFHIQSPVSEPSIIRQLLSYECVVINNIVEYNKLPEIYSGADLLVIANDFDKKSISFLKYSMPTKASEYMISGTPVLVFSHHETAVSKFFSQLSCGCCVTENDENQLITALKLLISDQEYRARLGRNAIRIASELFDGEKKRKEFRELLIRTYQRNGT